LLLDGEKWLRAGGVYNKNVNFTEDISYIPDQVCNLGFAAYIRFECVGVASERGNVLAELFRCITTIQIIDSNV
jgi:hypothetical protein